MLQFRAWCEADPRHAEMAAHYEKMWTCMDRPREVGAREILQRDLALLERRKRQKIVGSVAAVSLFFVLVFSGWGVRRWSGREAPSPSGSLCISLPERRVLADGSVLECTSGSELAIDFDSSRFRRVSLKKGEAHVEVAPDSTRPFVVQAADVEFRAVGTAFSVRVATSMVEVLVTEGRVEVEPRTHVGASAFKSENPHAFSKTTVLPGHRLSVTVAPNSKRTVSDVTHCSETEIERRLAWRSPRIDFSDVPLQEVIAAINAFAEKKGGMRFYLAEPDLGETRMSGIFMVGDAQAFIGILENGFGVVAERKEDRTIVLRKGP